MVSYLGIRIIPSNVQGAFRRFDGLGEPACLGVGGGERIEEMVVLVMGQVARLLGQLHGLRAVAERGSRQVARNQARLLYPSA